MPKEIINLEDDFVACDRCNSDSDKSGGILFGSNVFCPKCAIIMEKAIKKYGEEQYIKARCPEGKSFHDWVVQDVRKGNPCVIEIITGKEFTDYIENL